MRGADAFVVLSLEHNGHVVINLAIANLKGMMVCWGLFLPSSHNTPSTLEAPTPPPHTPPPPMLPIHLQPFLSE